MLEGLDLDTAYVFTMTAVDASDNRSTPLELEVQTSDSGSPTWPGDAAITAAVVGDESVTLRWTTAVDLSAVTRYTILQNLVEVGTVAAPTTEFRIGDMMADTEYVFDVYAYDRVGNRSVSTQRLVIRTSDSQVPSWSVDALVNVSQIEETTAQVRWSRPPDNVGVVGYRVDVDGQTVYLGDGYPVCGGFNIVAAADESPRRDFCSGQSRGMECTAWHDADDA